MVMGEKKRKAGICLLCCCLMAALFTGCGNSGSEDTSDQVYYHIQETSIPDPDEGLMDVFEKRTQVSEQDLVLKDGTFYRIAQCWEMDEYEVLQVKHFVQILEPPYQEWVSYEVGIYYADELYRVPRRVLNAEDGRLLILAHNVEQCILASWQPGMEVPEKIPGSEYDNSAQDLGDCEMYRTSEGTLCAYDRSGHTVTVLDETLKVQGKKELGAEANIYGVTEEPGSGELLWYGTRNKVFGVWRLEDGTAVLSNDAAGDAAIGSANAQLHRGSAEDVGLYQADNQGLWRMEEGNVTELCHFSDRSYILEELYSMEASEDGGLLLFVKCDGEELLLRIEGNRVPLPEKQIITLATTHTAKSSLGRAISRFNRSNELYQVELLTLDTQELAPDYIAKRQEFIDQIQMETAAGRGPDLFSSEMINASDMVKNGYLQSLEGVLEDEDAYWQAALDSGRIQGELYGIPYDCSYLFLTTYSQSFAGSRQSWTLPELMEAVRSSDAEVLQNDLDGIAIVLAYALYDNDNKTFIDWENGKSHLEEAPFLELLEFAKEYADVGRHAWANDTEAVKEGKMIAVNPRVFGGLERFSYMSELENIFSGEPAHLGYPRSEGNGIYVMPRLFYLNAQSDKREGVEIFLRYLLSEETQRRHVEFSVNDFTYVVGEALAESPKLAVRLSALERSIELGLQKGPNLTNPIGHEGLSEEQAKWMRFLIENARPGNFYVQEIEDIIYEELDPFFQGQRTAEEAARILDNRVQLYLDERK